MDEMVSIEGYLDNMKSIEDFIIKYLADEDSEKRSFEDFINLSKSHGIPSKKHELKLFLYIISHIFNHFHRKNDFFEKIIQLIIIFQQEIVNFFSNSEIFDIFKGNKLALLSLFDLKILLPTKLVFDIITNSKYSERNYPQYFYPEFKNFYEEELIKEEDLDSFDKKRRIGENERYVCQMIRNDSIDEFVAYCTHSNLSLNSKIPTSIFETNSFLLKQEETSLIEYAAFFGSFQIMKHLQLSNVSLTPSLWEYAIHGRNAEMIHLLEDNHVEPSDETFESCFKESIKCHHNEIANYIEENLLKERQNVHEYCFRYYNFAFFPKNIDSDLSFYYLCKYDYFTLVELLLENQGIDINCRITQI